MNPQHSHSRHCGGCFIVPPGAFRRLILEATDEATRERLLYSLETSSFLRGRRVQRLAALAAAAPAKVRPRPRSAPGLDRTLYDCGQRRKLPGREIRREGQPPTADATANHAYDNSGATYNFYKQILDRNSVDGLGLPLLSSVHYGRSFNNAFWDGSQMVYGDGDGTMFLGFANIVDVVAHELTHGVTQYTVPGGLNYEGLSGALNESISDVFGSVVKQWVRNETVDQADWLIGAGMLGPGLGIALRSMARPGTAWKYDDQPDHMSKVDPNADVHTNSGVPNRAFYLAASGLGGHSWDKAARIWYAALPGLKPSANFHDMCGETAAMAKSLYSAAEARIVVKAWGDVGVC